MGSLYSLPRTHILKLGEFVGGTNWQHFGSISVEELDLTPSFISKHAGYHFVYVYHLIHFQSESIAGICQVPPIRFTSIVQRPGEANRTSLLHLNRSRGLARNCLTLAVALEIVLEYDSLS